MTNFTASARVANTCHLLDESTSARNISLRRSVRALAISSWQNLQWSSATFAAFETVMVRVFGVFIFNVSFMFLQCTITVQESTGICKSSRQRKYSHNGICGMANVKSSPDANIPKSTILKRNARIVYFGLTISHRTTVNLSRPFAFTLDFDYSSYIHDNAPSARPAAHLQVRMGDYVISLSFPVEQVCLFIKDLLKLQIITLPQGLSLK